MLGLCVLLWGVPAAVCAQIELLPEADPQRVFARAGGKIHLLLRNAGDQPRDLELRTFLYQASSATTVPLEDTPWKKLRILPGQTILEFATLDFPAVRAETRFLVQWIYDTNRVLGTTHVLVYPPDLLKGLRPLAGGEPLGVLDPQNQLKPVLKAVEVEFVDLETAALKGFCGKLAIVGPFQSKAQMREGLANDIKALAGKGAAVVWIQPPPERSAELAPSFYTVPQGKGAVVVVQANTVGNLAESPMAQLRLWRLAQLAVQPVPLRLPSPDP